MNTTITIDKAGRVIIPKSVRDGMRLEAGDSLELEFAGESVTLRPVRTTGRLRKKGKFWVFQGGENLTPDIVNKVIRDIREERDRRSRGDDSTR